MIANAWHWLTAHWELVCAIIGVLITILNSATTVWHEHAGLVKWLLWIASALSLVRSKGADPGPLGALKLPLVPEGKGGAVPPAVGGLLGVLVVLLLLAASGCCSTTRCYLARGLLAVEAADKLAAPALDVACTAKIAACGQVSPESCPPFKLCTAAATSYQVAMDAIGRALGVCNKALADVGVK